MSTGPNFMIIILKRGLLPCYNPGRQNIKIDAIIVKLKERESYSDEKIMNDIRNLQDTIFDNRANSPQIPDRFYFKYRDQCEETAQEITKELEKLITS